MKVKIKLPENLSEISLAQYQSFLKQAKDVKGDELKALMVNHFCLVPLDKVGMIEKSSIDEICFHLDNLFIQDKPLVRKFNLKGFNFGFIPKLDAITFGEYVDLDKYIGDWEEMHRAMAVLFRPISTEIKEEYNIVDYEGTEAYSELMKLMPLNVVLGSQVFFYNLGSELLKALPNYLERQAREIIQRVPNLEKDGDGTLQFINSLEVILDTLKKSLDYRLLQPSLI
jgi:hypothetical protein